MAPAFPAFASSSLEVALRYLAQDVVNPVPILEFGDWAGSKAVEVDRQEKGTKRSQSNETLMDGAI
jgi:hypothetical protein